MTRPPAATPTAEALEAFDAMLDGVEGQLATPSMIFEETIADMARLRVFIARADVRAGFGADRCARIDRLGEQLEHRRREYLGTVD